MSKTTIILIVVGIVVLTIIILIATRRPSAVSDNELAEISAMLEDPTNPKRDCRRLCDTLVRHRPILFGGRLRAKGKCMSDCAQGIDVTKKAY